MYIWYFGYFLENGLDNFFCQALETSLDFQLKT